MPKIIANIFLLLIVLLTSLPVKHASRLFFKKQVQQEMCDDCCDAPEKKADDTVGFKEYPCFLHYNTATPHAIEKNIFLSCFHTEWCLPKWPAVEVHTLPPNRA